MVEVTVFVSSKMKELEEERTLLFDFLPELSSEIAKFKPWVFEKDAPASNRPIRDVYLEALQQAALYIGIFWKDYGEWTIDEFERATEWNIPRHVYVKDVTAEERDPRLTKFLDQHGDVTSGITAKWFKTLDELKDSIRHSITEWFKNSIRTRRGANRAIILHQPDDVTDLPESDIVGRNQLLATIKETLNDKNVRLLLQGFGGTGKTALAAKIAYDWLEDEKGDVLWWRAGASEKEAAFEAIAHPFQVTREIARASDEVKAHLLRQKMIENNIHLVVLDDVWNGETLRTIESLIPRRIPLLVTARQRYPLRRIINVPNLSSNASVALLTELAPEAVQDSETALALCEALGNLAFAIEVAGYTMRANNYTVAKMLQDIQNMDITRLSVPLEYTTEGRENLAALIETTLHALPHDAKTAFLNWGAFWSPQLTPELLALYQTELPTLSSQQIEDFLKNEDSLQNSSDEHIRRYAFAKEIENLTLDITASEKALNVLQHYGLAQRFPEKSTQHGNLESVAYYRLHDLAFAYTTAKASDESHLSALKASLALTARHGKAIREDFAALVPELDNLVAASSFAIQAQEFETVEELVSNLFAGLSQQRGILFHHPYTEITLDLLHQAFKASETIGNQRGKANFLGYLGIIYAIGSQYSQSIDYSLQSLTIWREIGDKGGEASNLTTMGITYRDLGEYDKALNSYQQALVLARELGNRIHEGILLGNIGLVYSDLGDYEKAIDYYQQALVIADEGNENPRVKGRQFGNLGIAYRNLGQYDKALDSYQQALALSREIGDKYAEGAAVGNIGNTYRSMKEYGKAIDYHQQALVISREIGDRYSEGLDLGSLGMAYQALGQYETAINYYQQALKIRQEVGDKRGESVDLNCLGETYELLEKHKDAITFYEQALAIRQELNVPHLIEETENNLQRVRLKFNDD